MELLPPLCVLKRQASADSCCALCRRHLSPTSTRPSHAHSNEFPPRDRDASRFCIALVVLLQFHNCATKSAILAFQTSRPLHLQRGHAGEEENGVQFAALSKFLIRDFRQHGQSQNHLFKLMHRGYTGTLASGDEEQGHAGCPFEFYRNWVNSPGKARAQAQQVTRSTVGTAECPIDGLPHNGKSNGAVTKGVNGHKERA